MNPPLNQADKLLGAATLLLLGLAGFWLRQPQPLFRTPFAAPTIRLAESDTPSLEARVRANDAKKPKPVWPKPQPWHFVSPPTLARPLVMRRYVGTIDGQPATAELQWYAPDSVWGRFYLRRGEWEYTLHNWQKPGPVVLAVSTNDTTVTTPGQWRLLSRPGGQVLQAIWQQGTRRRRVELRENYAGAVRYGISTVLYADGSRGSLRHDFLTLPAPSMVHPRLRPQLSPGPKTRLRQLTQERDSVLYAQRRLRVRLNDYGLFSYQLDYECQSNDEFTVCGPALGGLDSFLFDLAAGRPLTVESQLCPGYEKPLRRLLSRNLSSDLVDFCFSRYLLLQEMPDAGLCLTWSGLEAAYAGPVKCGVVSISVPYRELRPLVRPGTPLARMLRARGL